MIAVFLKNADGDFDYPAVMLSLFFIFAISGMIFGLYRAFKTGRILVSWGFAYGGSGQFYIEREKNPLGFCFVVAIYCLAISLLIALIIAVCFGLLRKTA